MLRAQFRKNFNDLWNGVRAQGSDIFCIKRLSCVLTGQVDAGNKLIRIHDVEGENKEETGHHGAKGEVLPPAAEHRD